MKYKRDIQINFNLLMQKFLRLLRLSTHSDQNLLSFIYSTLMK